MNIEIRKLTPDLAEDYVHFFDVTPHDDHTIKNELPCYCVMWRSDDSYVGNDDHWYPIATQLLERVCEDAASDGFDYVEAYVNEKHINHDFRGPLAMYEKCGFIAYAELESRVVVRKVLK